MSVERGPKSLQEHNKSLLYSNRPKFKEDLRENIHKDQVRLDGIQFHDVDHQHLETVLSEIRSNARKEIYRQLKFLVISVFITALLFLYLKDHLDNRF